MKDVPGGLHRTLKNPPSGLADDSADSSIKLCEQIMRLLDRLRLTYTEAAERYGLTKVQVIVLYTIYRTEAEVTMNSLAQDLHCDASNVTGIVDRLSTQDLLRRVESTRDRRAKILVLTKKGADYIEELVTWLPERLGCNRLSEVDRMRLLEILGKM